MIQQIFRSLYLLSAYGVDNKFAGVDILRRWMYIFERCLDKGVRIIGFSTGKFLFTLCFYTKFFDCK